MYLARQNAPKSKVAGDGDRWSDDDVKLLLELLDAGATAVQIASFFPTRRWVLLHLKITKLRGKGISISGAGELRRNETFYEYLARVGQTEDEYYVTVRDMTFNPNCPA